MPSIGFSMMLVFPVRILMRQFNQLAYVGIFKTRNKLLGGFSTLLIP
jgi:hypothetical protein